MRIHIPQPINPIRMNHIPLPLHPHPPRPPRPKAHNVPRHIPLQVHPGEPPTRHLIHPPQDIRPQRHVRRRVEVVRLPEAAEDDAAVGRARDHVRVLGALADHGVRKQRRVAFDEHGLPADAGHGGVGGEEGGAGSGGVDDDGGAGEVFELLE